jgi:cytochrome c1
MSSASSRLLAAALLLLVSIAACKSAHQSARDDAKQRVGGDQERGAFLLQRYGCGGCHRIPGVVGAAGRSAPSLEYLAQEAYIDGKLPNTPENLMRWIRSPRSVRPQTHMPELGVSENDARDMATYLWSLR